MKNLILFTGGLVISVRYCTLWLERYVYMWMCIRVHKWISVCRWLNIHIVLKVTYIEQDILIMRYVFIFIYIVCVGSAGQCGRGRRGGIEYGGYTWSDCYSYERYIYIYIYMCVLRIWIYLYIYICIYLCVYVYLHI
jgi:hypothetical protein